MSSFKNYWRKNRFKILQQRKFRYLYDEGYREKIKQRARVLSTIDRFLKPYKEELYDTKRQANQGIMYQSQND